MLYLVPTPVGNLEDITLRALRVLREARVILAEDTRTSATLLRHYDINVPMLSHHKFNEHQTADALARRMAAGEDMVLISDAGTPGISDPGFLLVRAAVSAGVEVQCLPGATAFVPALVASALPADRFVFEGFLPQKKGRATRLETLRTEERTMIFYESPHRILRTLQELAATFGAERPAATVRELSKLHEETLRDSLAGLIEHFTHTEPRGEFVLIVGGHMPQKRTAHPSTSEVDPITGQPIDAPPLDKAALRRSKRHRE